jgi:hypothetical protein
MATPKGQCCVANQALDFGEAIICEVSPRSVTIHLLPNFPLSFQMDLGELRRSRFKVELGIVQGTPPNSDIVIELSFNPLNRRCDDGGVVHYSIWSVFSDGHHVLLTLLATSVLPALYISLRECNFECIIIGSTKL